MRMDRRDQSPDKPREEQDCLESLQPFVAALTRQAAASEELLRRQVELHALLIRLERRVFTLAGPDQDELPLYDELERKLGEAKAALDGLAARHRTLAAELAPIRETLKLHGLTPEALHPALDELAALREQAYARPRIEEAVGEVARTLLDRARARSIQAADRDRNRLLEQELSLKESRIAELTTALAELQRRTVPSPPAEEHAPPASAAPDQNVAPSGEVLAEEPWSGERERLLEQNQELAERLAQAEQHRLLAEAQLEAVRAARAARHGRKLP